MHYTPQSAVAMLTKLSILPLLIMILMTSIPIVQPLFGQEKPPPFEKIYVTPNDIRTTSEGTFLITETGALEKVRAVRSDWFGTYVLKFKQECPVCGRFYDDNTIEDGYDCPLSQTEIIPHLWSK